MAQASPCNCASVDIVLPFSVFFFAVPQRAALLHFLIPLDVHVAAVTF